MLGAKKTGFASLSYAIFVDFLFIVVGEAFLRLSAAGSSLNLGVSEVDKD